jgi:hypothetical protein
MEQKPKIAWAVEYVENGQSHIHMHYAKHTTPEEAKNAFADHMGIPWKELERRGAKVIQHTTSEYPPDPPDGKAE